MLDEVILRNLLGVSESLLADENNINFKHDLLDAFLSVQSGDFEVGFFINPTRIEQVQNVATAGLIMPHKSTYFYLCSRPKSGQASRCLQHSRKPPTAPKNIKQTPTPGNNWFQ